MSPLDHYLNRVARQLRDYPASITDNELRELRSHLELLIHDGVALGSMQEEATRAALSQFGSARIVGNKLVDAWDGREMNWTRVCIAIFCGAIFWLRAFAVWELGGWSYSYWPLKALFPEIPYLLAGLFAGISFTTGLIFSIWLGRRCWPLNFVFCVLAYPFFQFFRMFPFFPSWTEYVSNFKFPFALCFLQLVISSLGVWSANRWYARFRFSQIGSSDEMIRKNGSILTDFHNIRWEKVQLVTIWGLTLSLGMAGGAKVRFDSVIHPRSAIQALRVFLLTSRASDFEEPQIIEIREYKTSSERIRRVEFKVVASVSRDLRQLQLQRREKQLLSFPQEIDAPTASALRASIQRVRANAFEIHGVALVEKTPQGWQVDPGSFDFMRLYRWANDIYSDR